MSFNLRCDVPARAVANALRDICKKILIERSLAQSSSRMGIHANNRLSSVSSEQASSVCSSSSSSSNSLINAAAGIATLENSSAPISTSHPTNKDRPTSLVSSSNNRRDRSMRPTSFNTKLQTKVGFERIVYLKIL